MNFKYRDIYICIRVLFLLKCQNADIGLVRPEGNPCMYVHPVLGEEQGLIRVLEGKLARLTHRVLLARFSDLGQYGGFVHTISLKQCSMCLN